MDALYKFSLLVHLQYSLFGSILTIGAMIGAIMSGKIADYIGRRGVSISYKSIVVSGHVVEFPF